MLNNRWPDGNDRHTGFGVKVSMGYIVRYFFLKNQEKSSIKNINFTKGIIISETLKAQSSIITSETVIKINSEGWRWTIICNECFPPKNKKIPQWLRAPAALTEDHIWFSKPTEHLGTTCNSKSRLSDTLFWPQRAPVKYMVHMHTYRQNIPTHKLKLN